MQTARATEEIRGRIQGIQGATGIRFLKFSRSAQVINEVDSIVGTIAAAVEEQSVTTRDIADNVGQASQGVQEVNENVSQAEAVTRDIAREVTSVSAGFRRHRPFSRGGTGQLRKPERTGPRPQRPGRQVQDLTSPPYLIEKPGLTPGFLILKPNKTRSKAHAILIRQS